MDKQLNPGFPFEAPFYSAVLLFMLWTAFPFLRTFFFLLHAGCFKDHVVGEDLIADYLLFTLNKSKCFKW